MASRAQTLYPDFAVTRLGRQLGNRWAELVEQVSHLPYADPHAMAYSLTMRQLQRLRGAEPREHHNPFCAACAMRLVADFQGGEAALLDVYYENLAEIMRTSSAMQRQARARRLQAQAA